MAHEPNDTVNKLLQKALSKPYKPSKTVSGSGHPFSMLMKTLCTPHNRTPPPTLNPKPLNIKGSFRDMPSSAQSLRVWAPTAAGGSGAAALPEKHFGFRF